MRKVTHLECGHQPITTQQLANILRLCSRLTLFCACTNENKAGMKQKLEFMMDLMSEVTVLPAFLK